MESFHENIVCHVFVPYFPSTGPVSPLMDELISPHGRGRWDLIHLAQG